LIRNSGGASLVRWRALTTEYTCLLDEFDQETIPCHDERGEDDQGVEEAVFRRESIFAFHDTTPLRYHCINKKPGGVHAIRALGEQLVSYTPDPPPGSLLSTTKPDRTSPVPDAITLCATKMRRHKAISASSSRESGCV
jgi:hypothetical protein